MNYLYRLAKHYCQRVESKQSAPFRNVKSKPVKVTHCPKCNCMLFPDEIMCPDCLTPNPKNH